MRQLKDMVVVITGASSGIGAELAATLAAAGAKLAVCARRDHELAKLATRWGGNVMTMGADVSDPDQCRIFIEAAGHHFGRIDTVVANAGYGLFRTIESTTVAEWQAIVATNVLGTTACFQAALPWLRRNQITNGWRGQLMAVSSGLARRAMPDMGAYSATKAMQLSLCEAMRIELKSELIAVTSVHPIGTATNFAVAAEHISGTAFARPAALSEPQQTTATVVGAMVKGITRPRPEVWSSSLRWLLALNALWPALGDRVMSKHRRQAVAGT